jgi:hypothetical protein
MLIAEIQNSKQKMAVQKCRQAVLAGDVQNVNHYNTKLSIMYKGNAVW